MTDRLTAEELDRMQRQVDRCRRDRGPPELALAFDLDDAEQLIAAARELAAIRGAGLTPERRDYINKVRNCVVFIEPDAGVKETQAAFDELLSVIDSQAAEVARLKEALAGKERDSGRLDYLDALVKHPPFRCDVILQHDYEDGVWLASIERGRSYGVTPIDSDISTPHLDVRAAIDSAAKERPITAIAPAAEGGAK